MHTFGLYHLTQRTIPKLKKENEEDEKQNLRRRVGYISLTAVLHCFWAIAEGRHLRWTLLIYRSTFASSSAVTAPRDPLLPSTVVPSVIVPAGFI